MDFNEWIENYVNDDVTRKVMAEWNEKILLNKQVKIAREMGLEEGMKQGMEEGIKLGKEEGARNRDLEIAKNLINMYMSVEDIAKATNLSKEEIIQLKEGK